MEKLDTSKPFLFEYKAAVGSDISVMKGSKKKLLSGTAVVNSSSRKKRKGGLLKESVKMVGVSVSGAFDNLVGHESGNTTELESVNMGEEYLIEKTSFQPESEGESGGDDTEVTPKGPKRIVTKHVLGKPLGTINFGRKSNDNDDVLDDSILFPLPLLLKSSVQISVYKSFALNFNLVAVSRKLSQEKLHFVRKLFSGVNGFGRAFTSSKFGGIIWATFTSEEVMMTTANLANDYGIVVNTNLKRPVNNHTNQAIVLKKIPVGTFLEAVCATVTEFGIIKSIKMQLPGLTLTNNRGMPGIILGLCYILFPWEPLLMICGILLVLLVGKPASLIAILLVILAPNVPLSVKDAGIAGDRKAPLLAQDQSRLASVVGTSSAPSLSGSKASFGSVIDGKPTPPVAKDLEMRLVNIEDGLISFAGQINELTKRLELLMLVVSQSGHRCRLPVTIPPQNSESNVTVEMDLSMANGHESAIIVNSSTSPHVVKLENMLEDLSKSVLSLSARFNSLVLAGSANFQSPSQ
ncbi:hypothetical protein G9A89_014674 [Geosiphon pyriformis]|nr:hypothetical protein G9A89_014674 [Geosiphon pyriformis]